MKKTIAFILSALLLLSLCSCGAGSKAKKVGVCQLVQHPALDAATQGFCDALKEALGSENVVIEVKNASGDSATCSTIVNGFVSSKADLIMANATPALQAAAAATDKIPILGTSITDYGAALDIEGFTGTVGGNVSGTSDLAPLDQQALMVKEWFPDAKTCGIIFCTAEANSRYQVDVVKAELEKLGISAKEFSFTDSNDIASVVQSACESCDVLYIPTDNTCANNAESIANIVIPAKVPVICGEEGICSSCGVATITIDYYDIGVKTGKMAAEILTGGADISKMPVAYAPEFTRKYNPAICESLGITPLENYEAIE
ncbi:MAG: ABC transporter substrate-binding protein [Firmicutes bacterium]|nr:ABC transporter substrate-binding protein [Bacillota bacterium]